MSIFTDTNKLIQRIDSHKKFSKKDVNTWIFKKISLKDGEKLLDIGCGTGAQLLKLVTTFPNSEIFGIDASDTSLEIIKNYCKKNNITNVTTIQGNMDDCISLLKDTTDFDVIISSYALYYSENIPTLISNIKKILKPSGRFFVCGPMKGNNLELIEFQAKIENSLVKEPHYFMTEDILPEIKKNFKNVSEDYFSNPTHFPDSISLIQYWKSYYLYDEKIEKQFLENIKKFFEKNHAFVTTKKSIGILASSN